MADQTEFMTTEEFANLIRITVSTAYSYIHYKQLPSNLYRTLGRKHIFIRQAVIDWVIDGAKLSERKKRK